MRFGDLSDALDNERSIYEAIEANVITNELIRQQKQQSSFTGKISNILKTLSNYGMSGIDDKVLQNMRAIAADKQLQPKEEAMLNQSLYGGMMNNWKIKGEEEKAFKEKTLEQKRDLLRKLAMNPELEDILDVMANEAIVYDDDLAYVCQPFLDTRLTQDLNEQNAEEIKRCMSTSFYKMYLLLNWKTNCWDDFKRFLIDGVLAYQIVYDDITNPHSVIGIIDVDPATLTKVVDKGVTTWVQFKDVQGKERVLLDSEIVYIKYEDSGVSTRQSYLERLIRPFNLYRIIEQAQVIWTVTQSSFKTMFTIPVGGMSKIKGMQTLAQAMNRYKEDVNFNIESGELTVNGKVNIPANKEYWMPSNEAGTPEIQTLVDNGPMLNDSDQIKYFESKLYKMSKIPESRFDKEGQQTWFGSDPTSQLRDEINFGRFVTRIRNSFAEILLKPLRIQVALTLPDLKNDKRILEAISLQFNSYNQFEEMMNIELMTKRVEFIQTMKEGITEQDAEGNDVSFFSSKFLVEKYLKMSEADIELNEKYKHEAKLLAAAAEENNEESDGEEEMGGGDEEDTEEPESDESNEVDDEMLGDVQPESSETTQA